jgi:ankyrin repeat protein
VTVIKRFRFLHHRILRDRLSNVTEPIRLLIARGANQALRDTRGMTAQDIAAQTGSSHAAVLLSAQ